MVGGENQLHKGTGALSLIHIKNKYIFLKEGSLHKVWNSSWFSFHFLTDANSPFASNGDFCDPTLSHCYSHFIPEEGAPGMPGEKHSKLPGLRAETGTPEL